MRGVIVHVLNYGEIYRPKPGRDFSINSHNGRKVQWIAILKTLYLHHLHSLILNTQYFLINFICRKLLTSLK